MRRFQARNKFFKIFLGLALAGLAGCGSGSDSFDVASNAGNSVQAPAVRASLLPEDPEGDPSRGAGGPDILARGGFGVTGDGTMDRCVGGNGRYLVFHTNEALLGIDTNNQFDVYQRDLLTGELLLLSCAGEDPTSATAAANGFSGYASISSDGRFVVYASEASDIVSDPDSATDMGLSDIYLWDRDNPTTTTRISRRWDGSDTLSGACSWPVINDDGSVVAFTSTEDLLDLMSGGSVTQQIYRLDPSDSTTVELVSSPDGSTLGNGASYQPSISGDGQTVAYTSAATNLGPTDSSAVLDIYRYDGATVTTTLLTPSSNGPSYMPSVSDDGTLISFDSYTSNLVAGDTSNSRNVFVQNTTVPITARMDVSAADVASNGVSQYSSISRDGTKVCFSSKGSNLTPGDTNGVADIFTRDIADATTIARVSQNIYSGDGGDQASDFAAWSDTGQAVLWRSASSNLDWYPQYLGTSTPNRELFLFDVLAQAVGAVGSAAVDQTALITLLTGSGTAQSSEASTSADGRFVAFSSAFNGFPIGFPDTGRTDVFIYDRLENTYERASRTIFGGTVSGNSGEPRISPDGRYVVYRTEAIDILPELASTDTNGVSDVYIYDRVTDENRLVSGVGLVPTATGNGDSNRPSVSAGGEFVAFASLATDLTTGDTDNSQRQIFLKNMSNGAITRVSQLDSSTPGDGDSAWPAISHDGRYVAYETAANNLDAGTDGAGADIYVYDANTVTNEHVSRRNADPSMRAVGTSRRASISADGRYVAYENNANNASNGPVTGKTTPLSRFEIIVHDRQASSNANSRVSVADGITGAQPSNAGNGTPSGNCLNASISADGRTISFETEFPLDASDLNGVSDIYVRNVTFGRTVRASFATDPSRASSNGVSSLGSISADGRFVVFQSAATNLVPDDTNNRRDIFAHRLLFDSIAIP